ncbi:hypothetical protein D1871_04905 [Nakamurella silvestris]|nr:hypothetical protein D1871_04905 [Nakamurella silvestris]
MCRQLGITRRTLDHWITRWEQAADTDAATGQRGSRVG